MVMLTMISMIGITFIMMQIVKLTITTVKMIIRVVEVSLNKFKNYDS